MDELEALKTIDATFAQLSEGAIARTLQWLNNKYSMSKDSTKDTLYKSDTVTSEKTKLDTGRSVKTKKIKLVLKQDKNLNFSPPGAPSATDFIAIKRPTNHLHKCVVACYYLENSVGVSPVTVDHVYTFFKFATWPVPANLFNALQQAGTAGWLDTSKSTDIKVTSAGENLVEHGLPKGQVK